ncbi:WYL domain-containing protein [Streptomyces decoyicus]|uniref:helix-turn-helix transcriptional regulator n=1 Tax=Streptomyces decoyicus TaxID=249567 RepID=UPI002E19A2A0
MWNQRRIRVRYRSWAEPQEVERELAPYGLVLKAGVWYLVAAVDGAVRTYRMSSILRLDVGQDGFERPDGFGLAAHWRDYLTTYDARRLRLQASVRIAPALLSALPDRLDAALVRAVEASAGPPGIEGGGEGSGHEQPLGPAGVVAGGHGASVRRFTDTFCQ